MLIAYDHWNLFNSFIAGIVFRRQIPTSKDGIHAERVNLRYISFFDKIVRFKLNKDDLKLKHRIAMTTLPNSGRK